LALGFGIVGIGNLVRATMAPAMVADPDLAVVACTSRSRNRAEAFAAQFGGAAYDDYGQMLANPAVGAVFVATPNAQHRDQVVAAAQAGKHVFCDKPLGLTAAEAGNTVDACAAAGVHLGVNFHNRHLPWVIDSRQLIADGALGEVHTIQVEASAGDRPPTDWRLDPQLAGLGTVFNVGVHVLDFVGYLLDDRPVAVVADFDDEEGRYRVETGAMILLRYSKGARVYVNCNQNNPRPQNDIAIYGSRGRILGRGVTRSRADGELHVQTAAQDQVVAYPSPGAHRLSMVAFARAVRVGRTPNASGADGLRSAELTDAIARSVRERRFVELTPSNLTPSEARQGGPR
jgi:1,5-anhydro-D-fructose reductase (1,5-anhydro-D-mannitol-forming)